MAIMDQSHEARLQRSKDIYEDAADPSSEQMGNVARIYECNLGRCSVEPWCKSPSERKITF